MVEPTFTAKKTVNWRDGKQTMSEPTLTVTVKKAVRSTFKLGSSVLEEMVRQRYPQFFATVPDEAKIQFIVDDGYNERTEINDVDLFVEVIINYEENA